MSNEMVERAARAIFALLTKCDDPAFWEDLDPAYLDFNQDYYRNLARASIEAMREPTRAMQEAGRIELGETDDHNKVYLHAGEVEDVWQAMIDSALSSEQRGGDR